MIHEWHYLQIPEIDRWGVYRNGILVTDYKTRLAAEIACDARNNHNGEDL